jgi:hypothetical protein
MSQANADVKSFMMEMEYVPFASIGGFRSSKPGCDDVSGALAKAFCLFHKKAALEAEERAYRDAARVVAEYSGGGKTTKAYDILTDIADGLKKKLKKQLG